MIAELLQAKGWHLNHKKVEQLWREGGLRLSARHKKRKRLNHIDASLIDLRPKYPNHIWAIDFVHDKLSNGRPYKMLTVMDELTRQALTVHVGNKLGSAEVLEALYLLIIKNRKPEYIRNDFIISAEIMALGLTTVQEISVTMTNFTLSIVASLIPFRFYGGVALIADADGYGTFLITTARVPSIGKLIIKFMPQYLHSLTVVETPVVLWLGFNVQSVQFGTWEPMHSLILCTP